VQIDIAAGSLVTWSVKRLLWFFHPLAFSLFLLIFLDQVVWIAASPSGSHRWDSFSLMSIMKRKPLFLRHILFPCLPTETFSLFL